MEQVDMMYDGVPMSPNLVLSLGRIAILAVLKCQGCAGRGIVLQTYHVVTVRE